MTRALYGNRISLAKAYMPFHKLNLQAETIDDNFIEVVDEPQITLKAILDCIDTSNIIEVWKLLE
ncbi:hypothetical protein RirG_255780 [Rhizophagus irregularis DAOM 197198w]|uniref:Uncharacterized protein n=1 Tax=Rhizophagus irregularis (strain DAOM 197198w) TaxID=1432141 RepID=A0A015JYE9_RHIIW|nr:hypothetical protein RirG_255780 [Rhizophagus irregularis DAOM 197198w]